FFQAEDGIRDLTVTGVQTCALPIFPRVRLALGRGAEHPGRLLLRCRCRDDSGVGTGGLALGRVSTLARGRASAGRRGLLWSWAKIGRASCRERVWIWVGAVSLSE